MWLLCQNTWRLGRIFLPAVMLLALSGCFTERSFPMKQQDLHPLPVARVRQDGVPLLTRQWVDAVEPKLREELPPLTRKSLTTSQLADKNGTARDVYRTFGISRANLDTLYGNYWGLLRSAQVSPRDGKWSDSDWPGYQPVEIPADGGLKLCGRIAPPTGKDLGGSYIVISHGLFGRQAGQAQYNIAEAMRAFGHHVLTIDMRGHGETGRRHPEYPCTFGLDEPRDLLAVSRWVRATYPDARRVGLIGYSLGAHQALMSAWLDGDPRLAGDADSPIVRTLAAPELHPQYNAGIFAISPVLNLIDYANSLDQRRTLLDSPLRSIFQDRTSHRMKELAGKSDYRVWDLMECELRRSRWIKDYPNYTTLLAEDLRFIDFCQLEGPALGARRMETVRVPVLVLEAADDPLCGSAQAVADVFAGVQNPNCGVILLKEGGHGGFPALSRSYFYSLLRGFFDPATAPRAIDTYPDLVRRDPTEREPMRMGQ